MPEGPKEWSLDGWSAPPPSLPVSILSFYPLLPDLVSRAVAWKNIQSPIKVLIIPKSVDN